MSDNKAFPLDKSWEKKTYCAYFEYQGSSRGEQRLRNFAWWPRVMQRVVDLADTFRIECSSRDDEGLLFCARMGAAGQASVRAEGRIEIWEGNTSPHFISEFVDRPFDAMGRLKWKSVVLKRDGKTLLVVSYHGTRIGFHGVRDDDLEYFAGAVHSLYFSYYYWEEAQSGQMVHFQPIYAYEGDLSDIIEAYQRGCEEKDR